IGHCCQSKMRLSRIEGLEKRPQSHWCRFGQSRAKIYEAKLRVRFSANAMVKGDISKLFQRLTRGINYGLTHAGTSVGLLERAFRRARQNRNKQPFGDSQVK